MIFVALVELDDDLALGGRDLRLRIPCRRFDGVDGGRRRHLRLLGLGDDRDALETLPTDDLLENLEPGDDLPERHVLFVPLGVLLEKDKEDAPDLSATDRPLADAATHEGDRASFVLELAVVADLRQIHVGSSGARDGGASAEEIIAWPHVEKVQIIIDPRESELGKVPHGKKLLGRVELDHDGLRLA